MDLAAVGTVAAVAFGAINTIGIGLLTTGRYFGRREASTTDLAAAQERLDRAVASKVNGDMCLALRNACIARFGLLEAFVTKAPEVLAQRDVVDQQFSALEHKVDDLKADLGVRLGRIESVLDVIRRNGSTP